MIYVKWARRLTYSMSFESICARFKTQGRAYREEGLVKYNKNSEDKMKIWGFNTLIPSLYSLIPILYFNSSLFTNDGSNYKLRVMNYKLQTHYSFNISTYNSALIIHNLLYTGYYSPATRHRVGVG